jgi:hypothetical protein
LPFPVNSEKNRAWRRQARPVVERYDDVESAARQSLTQRIRSHYSWRSHITLDRQALTKRPLRTRCIQRYADWEGSRALEP